MNTLTFVAIMCVAIGSYLCGMGHGAFATAPPRRPPKRKRPPLRVHYLRGDDGLIFRVRCRPEAFRRVVAKIEDEECEGS